MEFTGCVDGRNGDNTIGGGAGSLSIVTSHDSYTELPRSEAVYL